LVITTPFVPNVGSGKPALDGASAMAIPDQAARTKMRTKNRADVTAGMNLLRVVHHEPFSQSLPRPSRAKRDVA
jgi:hypothetical protein